MYGICVGRTRLFTDLNINFDGQNVRNLWKMLHENNCQRALLLPRTMLDLIQNKDVIMQNGFKLEEIVTFGNKIDNKFRGISGNFCRNFTMGYGTCEADGIAYTALSNEIHVGDVGIPYPGVQVKVVGKSGDTLPCGEMGDILVKSPSGFNKYRNDPGRTKQSFTPEGWYRTGDM